MLALRARKRTKYAKCGYRLNPTLCKIDGAILHDSPNRQMMLEYSRRLKEVFERFPHLQFRRNWDLSKDTAIALGECLALIENIAEFPLEPAFHRELLTVSLTRGAQATTAIEGNTLTDDEIQEVLAGKPMPPSRQYQAQEIRNAVDAMNTVWQKMQPPRQPGLVTPKLICEFHRQVGKDLGEVFDAIPGKTRRDRRHVGTYLAPDYDVVDELLEAFCEWLKTTFKYSLATQAMEEAIQQAVAAHVYFEWIHPFGDGNGRTGRLIEFYILLRAGLPDICAHVLANHYNNSRQEYTHHFDRARTQRSLTAFMEYSICGLRDGLRDVMTRIQSHIFAVAWKSHVYDVFSKYQDYNKKTIFKRRRQLALAMPIDIEFAPGMLMMSVPTLFAYYSSVGPRSLEKDMQTIVELKLARPSQTAPGKYIANTEVLKNMKAIRIGPHC